MLHAGKEWSGYLWALGPQGSKSYSGEQWAGAELSANRRMDAPQASELTPSDLESLVP